MIAEQLQLRHVGATAVLLDGMKSFFADLRWAVEMARRCNEAHSMGRLDDETIRRIMVETERRG